MSHVPLFALSHTGSRVPLGVLCTMGPLHPHRAGVMQGQDVFSWTSFLFLSLKSLMGNRQLLAGHRWRLVGNQRRLAGNRRQLEGNRRRLEGNHLDLWVASD